MTFTRLIALAALSLAATPAFAADPKDFLDQPQALQPKEIAATAADEDTLSEALATIDSHRVDTRVGCGIPLPVTYNAPPWQQRAAALRRQAFEDCLGRVMAREEGRLRDLEARVGAMSDAAPEADWSAAADALAAKWDELESVNDRLNSRARWADTAVNILDTFTGPGAPFDSGRRSGFNPYGGYRVDSSVSAPGIR